MGRHLVAALLALSERPEAIIATTVQADNAAPSGVCHAVMDITDAQQVRSVIAQHRPTHLFHLAAISGVPAAERAIRNTWAVNLDGTLNIALSIADEVPECRLLYCSSAFIYGTSFLSGKPVDEGTLLAPFNPYGASKAAADLLIGQMAAQGLRAIRLRPFNHTGVGQSEDFVVPAFAAQIAQIERGEKEPVLQVGDLSARRDFLDVRDVVEAYLRAMLRFDDLPRGCAMNIASGRAVSIKEVLDILLALSGKPVEIRAQRDRMRPIDAPIILGDATLARRLLDWTPRYELKATLASILQAMRAGPGRQQAGQPAASTREPQKAK